MEDIYIHRAALGRSVRIGDQYNAKTDRLLGTSCMKSSNFPIRVMHDDSSETLVSPTVSFKDRFNLLQISGDLQLSILTEMVYPEGSSRFLTESPPCPETSLRLSLLYSVRTMQEEMDFSDSSLLEYVDLDSISNDATHIIAGITWGGRAVLTAEYKLDEDENRITTTARLFGMMQKLGRAVKMQEPIEEMNIGDKAKLTISSDFSNSKETPGNWNTAAIRMKQLLSQTHSHCGGKGVPVTLTLVPIDVIMEGLGMHETLDRTVEFLDNATVDRYVSVWDDMTALRAKVDEILSVAETSRFSSENDIVKLKSIKLKIQLENEKFLKPLKQYLIAYRSCKHDGSILNHVNSVPVHLLRKEAMQLFEEFELASQSDVLTFIRETDSPNVEVIEDYVKFHNFLKKHDDVIAIFVSDDLIEEDMDAWYETKEAFVAEMNKEDTNFSFVIVKSDTCSSLEKRYKITKTCILRFHQRKLVVESVAPDSDENEFEDSVESLSPWNEPNQWNTSFDSNLASSSRRSIQTTPSVKTVQKKAELPLGFVMTNELKPISKTISIDPVPLLLPCPGLKCLSNIHQWACLKCRSFIVYGHDEHFYCACGCAQVHTYQFKCCDDQHGEEFVKYTANDFLSRLSELKAVEMNILILGETGVGKSTWINAFQNYAMFPSLEEAKQSQEMTYLIPSRFTVTDEKLQEHVVSIGKDENEADEAGKSATIDPRSYRFLYKDFMVRFIDTPGIGDTAGIEQDKKNFEQILKYLSKFDKLHGICILLKPNDARLTVMFRFCIQELLTHLHRDAARNIVFCFTNSRGLSFRPGDTFPALKRLLEENQSADIELKSETIYCMDNESFRFLLAEKQGVHFSGKEESSYATSWNHSVGEIERLIEHFSKLQPHFTNDTISLNSARMAIVKLTKPIAEMSRNIQNNIIVLNEYKTKLENSKGDIQELAKKLYTPKVDIIPTELILPMTVCTSAKCTRIVHVDGVQKIDYKTICHDACLDKIPEGQIGAKELQNCEAMKPTNTTCVKCGCNWNIHMSISYRTDEVMRTVEDTDVKVKIKNQKEAEDAVRGKIKEVEEIVKNLKQEQERITKVCVELGAFLKDSAITVYNDAMGEYLEHLIRQEKDKVAEGKDRKTLEGMESLLEAYKQEKIALEDASKRGGNKHLTPEEIREKIKSLYALPINGEKLQGIVAVADKVETKVARLQENQLSNSDADGTNKQWFIKPVPEGTFSKYWKKFKGAFKSGVNTVTSLIMSK